MMAVSISGLCVMNNHYMMELLAFAAFAETLNARSAVALALWLVA